MAACTLHTGSFIHHIAEFQSIKHLCEGETVFNGETVCDQGDGVTEKQCVTER